MHDEEQLKKFGKHIKKLRNDLGLTLSELANKIGYSNPYLSQIETGKRKRPPTPEFLRHLAKGLQVPYSAMLNLAGYDDLANGQLYAEIAHSEKLHFLEQDMNEDTKLGDTLKEIRKIYGFSLEELSEMTDLPISYLKDIESNNIKKIDQKTLSLIAKQFEDYSSEESINVYATLLSVAGFPVYESIGKSDSYNQVLVGSLIKHDEEVKLERTITEAKNSVMFSDDTLTDKEKSLVYSFVESLIIHREDD